MGEGSAGRESGMFHYFTFGACAPCLEQSGLPRVAGSARDARGIKAGRPLRDPKGAPWVLPARTGGYADYAR